MHGPRREYRGPYSNGAYLYSVVIPDHLVGYDGTNPFYQHGFGIILGEKPYSYVMVDGSPNSLEFPTAADAAKTSLEFLSHKAKIISFQVKPMSIDTLPGVFLVANYTCQNSPAKFVVGSVFAISPNKTYVYQLSLYATGDQFGKDRAVLDQILKSWRYMPR